MNQTIQEKLELIAFVGGTSFTKDRYMINDNGLSTSELKLLDDISSWDFAIYLVLDSDSDTSIITVIETKLSDHTELTVNSEIVKQISKLKLDLDKVISYSWILSPGSYDLSKSEHEIISWFHNYGAFSKSHQELTSIIRKLSEI